MTDAKNLRSGRTPKHPNNRKTPNQAPIAVLSIDSLSNLDVVVSTAGTMDGDGTIAAGQVDWGDDGAVTSFTGAPAATYSHTYAAAGTYTIILSVVDNKFAGDAAASTVTVEPVATLPDPDVPDPDADDPPPPDPIPVPPVAVLTYVSGQHRGEPYTLSTAGTLDSDGHLASGSLNWGDGSTADSWTGDPEPTYTHTYANAGTYTATLTVTDDDGLVATTTRQIVIDSVVVVNQPPIANLTFVSGGYAANPTVVSTAGTSDPEASFASGSIAWGDSSTTTWTGAPSATYTHTYAAAASYNALLTVTDSAGNSATDSLSITINAAPPATTGSAHDYFADLIARGDFFKGLSFRPDAGVSTSTDPYWSNQLGSTGGGFQASGTTPAITYSPATDTDANKQDAAKLIIPAWITTSSTITTALSPTDTVLHVSPYSFSSSVYAPGHRCFKLDSEIMSIVSKDGTASTVTVNRGQFGTTAASHSSGTHIQVNTNTLPTNLEFPFGTIADEDKAQKYLITWDCFWTGSYVNTGLTNHKAFNIETGDASIWCEPNTFFKGGGSATTGAFNIATDVCAFGSRSYAYQTGSTVTSRQPILPQANLFAIKPNTWVRFWYLFDIKAITDSFLWRATKLTADLASDATSMTVDITGELTSEVVYKNNYYKIDDEIVRASATGTKVSGNIYTIPISRAQQSTSAASHSTNAHVSGSCSMHLSAWIADENRAAVQLYNDLPLSPRPITGTKENALVDFVVEFNTSTDSPCNRFDRDLVAYVRNLCVLRSGSLDPSGDGLLVQPVR